MPRIAPSKYSIGGPVRRRRGSHSDTDADQPAAQPFRSEGGDRHFPRARGGNENGEDAGWPSTWLGRFADYADGDRKVVVCGDAEVGVFQIGGEFYAWHKPMRASRRARSARAAS